MNNFFIRLISGIFYVLLILWALTSDRPVITGFILFSIFLFLQSVEIIKLLRIDRNLFLFLTALFWMAFSSGIIYSAVVSRFGLYFNTSFLVANGILWFLLLAILLYLIFKQKWKSVLGFFYLIIPYAFSLVILIYNPNLLVFLFVLIWANDTFAYLTGKFFGKHKLAPSISPNKTIEGFIGGIVFVILFLFLALQIRQVTDFFDFLDARYFTGLVLLSLWLIIWATAGDLFESYLKRKAGVKDSGNIMPGHGGILDRLDSYMFAVVGFFLYLLIFYNFV